MKNDHLTSFFFWRYRAWTACDGDRVRSCKSAAEMGTSHWAGSRGDFPFSWKLHFFISNQVKRSFAKKEKEGEWGLNIKRVKVHLKEEGTRVSISRADCWSKEERNCWNWIPNLWISEFNSRQPWKYRILLIHHAQIRDYFLDLANFYIEWRGSYWGALIPTWSGWWLTRGPWKILILVCFDSELVVSDHRYIPRSHLLLIT